MDIAEYSKTLSAAQALHELSLVSSPRINKEKELAAVREQLKQALNTLAQREKDLFEALEQLKQAQNAFAQKNELAEVQKLLIQSQERVIQFMSQTNETFHNFVEAQPLSSIHREQVCSDARAEQDQLLQQTSTESVDAEEILRSDETGSATFALANSGESVTVDADNPRNAVTRNGNQDIITANTVAIDAHCEDFDQDSTATQVLRPSSSQCAPSSVDAASSPGRNNESCMGQSASNDSSGNRPTTASTSAQLPDGYYEIDLKYVVEAQNPVKAGRLIRILDGSGQPFVLNLTENQLPARGSMHIALTCRSQHGYYSCLFQLCEKNGEGRDVITRPFERDGTKQQKITLSDLTLRKRCDNEFYKPGEQKRDGRVTFSLTPFPYGASNEKIDAWGKSNKEVFEKYPLKKPKLIIWFTDESGLIHQPVLTVEDPAIEAPVGRPLNTADPVPSSVGDSFNTSHSFNMKFSVILTDVLTELVSAGRATVKLLQSANGGLNALYHPSVVCGKKMDSLGRPNKQPSLGTGLTIGKQILREKLNDPTPQCPLLVLHRSKNGNHSSAAVQHAESTTNVHSTVNSEDQQRPPKRTIDALASDDRPRYQKAVRTDGV